MAVPPAGTPTVGDLVNALNSNASGVGLYGAFTLDAQGGLTFTGAPPLNAQVSVVTDTTQRGVGGPSISALFGIGTAARVARPSSYKVNPALTANPSRMPFAMLNLAVTAGTPAISAGDGQGAQALADANAGVTLFKAAGALGNVSTTLSGLRLFPAAAEGSIDVATHGRPADQPVDQRPGRKDGSRRAPPVGGGRQYR